MNKIAIIQSAINNSDVNSVNARDLHKELGLKSDFSTWIKRELEMFSEDIDYIRLHKKMEANNATIIEYILTLDTAKHLAMIQRSQKGKEIRQYFIDTEKRLSSKPLSQMQMIAQMATDMHNQNVAVEQAQTTAANALGLAEKHDYIIENNKSQEIRPQKGFYTRNTLANKMAHKFPKVHSQAILVDPATVKRIRSHQCKTYVEATLSYEEYAVYNLDDTSDLIDDLIATGIRVLNKNGEPSTKVKSPLYGQSFKQPI